MLGPMFIQVMLCKAYIVRKSDDSVLTGVAEESGMEEVTARGEDRTVRSVTPVPHENGHITQHVVLPLHIQGAEYMGTVNC